MDIHLLDKLCGHALADVQQRRIAKDERDVGIIGCIQYFKVNKRTWYPIFYCWKDDIRVR